MSRLTNFAENSLVNHMMGKASFTMPVAVYLALFTSDPTETGSVVGEVTGGNYARVEITSRFNLATEGHMENFSEILFNTASANWGTVGYMGIMPSDAGSNMLMYAPLATAYHISIGEAFRYNPANVTVVFA